MGVTAGSDVSLLSTSRNPGLQSQVADKCTARTRCCLRYLYRFNPWDSWFCPGARCLRSLYTCWELR